MNSIKRIGFIASTLLLTTVFFTSCLKNHDDTLTNIPVARLMAFNLATDKPAVGFSLSGNQLGTPLGYNSYTGVYLNIYPGTRSVESFDAYTGNTIVSSSFTFDSSKFYSVFLTGRNNNYRNVIVHDNFDSLSNTSGKAYIRYINAIVDSTATPTVTIASGGVNAVNDNAAYASVSNFTAIAPGAVDIKVNNGGSINASRTITVEQRKIYTVLLSGVPGTGHEDSVQIRFITNGELDQPVQGASVSNARTSN